MKQVSRQRWLKGVACGLTGLEPRRQANREDRPQRPTSVADTAPPPGLLATLSDPGVTYCYEGKRCVTITEDGRSLGRVTYTYSDDGTLLATDPSGGASSQATHQSVPGRHTCTYVYDCGQPNKPPQATHGH